MTQHDFRDREIIIYLGTHKLVGLNAKWENEQLKVESCEVEVNPIGFEHGFVTHLDKASATLQSFVERIYGSSAEEVPIWVVLGNSKLQTYSFSSSQYFGNSRTIGSQEVRSVVRQTKSVATLPLSEFVLQAIPESFLVNDMAGIQDPLGLEASRLGVNLKIFTMHFESFKNIGNAFESAELNVRGYFPKTIMVSDAVLEAQEKEEGAVLVDIADDSIQFILWKNGHLIATQSLASGGRALTENIAKEWGIELRDAEKVKERFASLDQKSSFSEELIPLIERNGKVGHSIRREEFEEKFSAFINEWLADILSKMDEFVSHQRVLHPHVIFTGGAIRIDGFLEFLQQKYSRDARIGVAQKVDASTELLSDPSMAAALGLCRWLAEFHPGQERLLAPSNVLEKTIASARHWFAAYF